MKKNQKMEAKILSKMQAGTRDGSDIRYFSSGYPIRFMEYPVSEYPVFLLPVCKMHSWRWTSKIETYIITNDYSEKNLKFFSHAAQIFSVFEILKKPKDPFVMIKKIGFILLAQNIIFWLQPKLKPKPKALVSPGATTTVIAA